MRRLVLVAAVAPALFVLAAPPASASAPAPDGCTTAYVEAVTTMQARPFVEADGLDVTVYGSRVVAVPLNVAAATLAYVDCLV